MLSDPLNIMLSPQIKIKPLCKIKILKVVVTQVTYFNYDLECDISYDADCDVTIVYQNHGLCRTTNEILKLIVWEKTKEKCYKQSPHSYMELKFRAITKQFFVHPQTEDQTYSIFVVGT